MTKKSNEMTLPLFDIYQIKSLQHEIICKDAMPKAKKSGTAVTLTDSFSIFRFSCHTLMQRLFCWFKVTRQAMDEADPLLDTWGLQIHRGVTRSQSKISKPTATPRRMPDFL